MPLRIFDLAGEDITPRVIKLELTARRGLAWVILRGDDNFSPLGADGQPRLYEVTVGRVSGEHVWPPKPTQ